LAGTLQNSFFPSSSSRLIKSRSLSKAEHAAHMEKYVFKTLAGKLNGREYLQLCSLVSVVHFSFAAVGLCIQQMDIKAS
jgi:hypothetical protein